MDDRIIKLEADLGLIGLLRGFANVAVEACLSQLKRVFLLEGEQQTTLKEKLGSLSLHFPWKEFILTQFSSPLHCRVTFVTPSLVPMLS